MNSCPAPASRRCVATAVLFLLAGVAPALAVDGVLEIDQACALSGCFAGDAPGFPVEIINEGSYRLTSNLEVGNGSVTAISIPYSIAVVLDLNGFVVRGGYTCASYPPNCPALAGDGIHVGAVSTVTVRNGTIANVGHTGILLDGGSITTIEGVLVNFVGGRGIDSSSGHVTVRQSVVTNTQGDGIHALFAKVIDSRVSQVRGDAIEILDRGLVWGVETYNTYVGSLHFANNKLAGYALCRLDRTPIGGANLGQNLCADVATGGLCP